MAVDTTFDVPTPRAHRDRTISERRHSFGGSGAVFDHEEDIMASHRSMSTKELGEPKAPPQAQQAIKKIFKRNESQGSMNTLLMQTYHKTISFDQEEKEPTMTLITTPPLKEKMSSMDEEEGTAWDSKFQYLLALLGWAVGLGNIWRFPYLCFKHGGGAFLIPYTIMLIFEAFPLFFMELLLGQRHRAGSVKLWKKFDIRATGIGCASAVVCVLIALYYNAILAWASFYLANSFQAQLPWTECPLIENTTEPVPECAQTSPTEYYYYRTTLNFASWGEEGASSIVWPILLSNICIWLLVFLACVKGISSAGKAMYVTVIFPIVILLIFFFRAITLEGAGPGIAYLFKPKLEKVFSIDAWKDAATQTFFNLGLAYGTVISYSSFNPRVNDCQKDALFVATINAIVSIIASITVFGIIAFKSMKAANKCIFENMLGLGPESDIFQSELFPSNIDRTNLTIGEIDAFAWEPLVTNLNITHPMANCTQQYSLDTFKGGPGLAFITFPEAMTQLPAPQLWSVLFFVMVLMVGISSQIGILLGFLLPIHDSFLQHRINQPKFTGLTCATLAAIGVIFCLRSGINWVDIFDGYSGTLPLLVIALCEVLVASYVYKIANLEKDVLEACGFKKPSLLQPFWNVCWRFISPALLAFILAFAVYGVAVNPVNITYWGSISPFSGASVKEAPSFAKFCVLLILLLPLSWIPSLFIYYQRKRSRGTNTGDENENYEEHSRKPKY